MLLGDYYEIRKRVALFLRSRGWKSAEIYFYLRYGRKVRRLNSTALLKDFAILREKYELKLWEEWFKYERNQEEKLLSQEQRESLRKAELWCKCLSDEGRSEKVYIKIIFIIRIMR